MIQRDYLVVIDSIEFKYFEFNNLVTNFWIIKELLSRGRSVFVTTNNRLSLKHAKACATCFEVYLKDGDIFYIEKPMDVQVEFFKKVLFRPDPPVDENYINATYILDFVDRTKTCIINDTKAIRNFNEKLHANLFSEYMPENIVSSSREGIEIFLEHCGELILKPLNKCFGAGVMYLKHGDKNTRSIIDCMTNGEKSHVMVQRYIEKAKFGDKRVLTLGDRVLTECIVKTTTEDDFKFNTHSDKFIQKSILNESEAKKFTEVAKRLNSMGIFMAGLDVVDEQIIEVNVTSPCYFIKEINNYFGVNMERVVCDYIESINVGRAVEHTLRA